MSDVHLIYTYLKEADIYYLATVDENRPKVRPFSTVMVHEDRLYLLTGKGKDVYEELKRNPAAEIAVMGKDGTWIHISGDLFEDEREEVVKKMEALYPDFTEKYNQTEHPQNAVFCFRSGTAEVQSYRTEPVYWSL